MTAFMLKEEGYDVHGISFMIWDVRDKGDSKSCCSLKSVTDASVTAKQAGIEHYFFDARGEFADKVIEPFINGYKRGFTPNPCVLCNKHIKFPLLLKEADRRGIDYIATGHYVCIEKCEPVCLKKGIDKKKDQSYFLYVMTKEEIERSIFPLGRYKKEKVREIAGRLNLTGAEKRESQDICFVEKGKYREFIESFVPGDSSGPIHDLKSNIIGNHNGIHAYTVGQRRGLGIAAGQPLYVTKIDTQNNTIIVGPKESCLAGEFRVTQLNWIIQPSVYFNSAPEPSVYKLSVKFRSTMNEVNAGVYIPDSKSAIVTLDAPGWAPAPGQSAVFYSEDVVLGGGIIAGT